MRYKCPKCGHKLEIERSKKRPRKPKGTWRCMICLDTGLVYDARRADDGAPCPNGCTVDTQRQEPVRPEEMTFYSDSEIASMKRHLRVTNLASRKAADGRGYNLDPRIADARKRRAQQA